MLVCATGYCRSGTTNIVYLFKELGIESYHQPVGPEGHNQPHEFILSGQRSRSYFKNMVAKLRSIHGFVANWEFAHFMYELSQYLDIDWLIMLRDPYYAVNSHANYRAGKRSTVDQLAQLYNVTMSGILQQIPYMPKPLRWIAFDKYVRGEYARDLLKIFNLDQNKENIDGVYYRLGRKLNASHPYKCQPSKHFKQGRRLMHQIKDACPELGA